MFVHVHAYMAAWTLAMRVQILFCALCWRKVFWGDAPFVIQLSMRNWGNSYSEPDNDELWSCLRQRHVCSVTKCVCLLSQGYCLCLCRWRNRFTSSHCAVGMPAGHDACTDHREGGTLEMKGTRMPQQTHFASSCAKAFFLQLCTAEILVIGIQEGRWLSLDNTGSAFQCWIPSCTAYEISAVWSL